jgi:hypothetical protein
MLGLFGFKKKPEVAKGPQLMHYECPFPLSGDIVELDHSLYVTASEEDFAQFRSLADTVDGYILRVIRPGMLVWDKRGRGESTVTVKAFKILEGVPPEELWDVLHDPDYRAVWDDARVDTYLVSPLSPNSDIGYYAGKAPKPISSRDFLNQRCWMSAGGGEYLIFNTSVTHSKCPPKRGFVRAVSKISGYLIRPWGTDGKSCTLTYISNSDPKGWLPSSMVNMLVSSFAPAMLNKIQKAVEDWPAWRAKQSAWKRVWEQAITPWKSPPGNETYAAYQDVVSGQLKHEPTPPSEGNDNDDEREEDDDVDPPEGANGDSKAQQQEDTVASSASPP